MVSGHVNTAIFVLVDSIAIESDSIVGQDAYPYHGSDFGRIVVSACILDTVDLEVMLGYATVLYVKRLLYILTANVELIVCVDVPGLCIGLVSETWSRCRSVLTLDNRLSRVLKDQVSHFALIQGHVE